MHISEPASGNILLIDKNERLPAQRAIFENAGFTVLTATTTTEGLKVAEEKQPDLVISEVMLEKPDAGFVLGYHMKKNASTAQIPLLLLSSIFNSTGVVIDLNSPEGRQWVKADGLLDRPVSPERLLAKACGMLNQRHAL